MKKVGTLGFALILSLFVGLLVPALANAETIKGHEHLKDYLMRFHKNPAETVNQSPVEGAEPFYKTKSFTVSNEFNKNFSSTFTNQFNDVARDLRQLFYRDMRPFAAPTDDDKVENLVEGTILRNLAEIEKSNLRKAQLEKQPWSDSYWPMARGLIGNRYADPNFPEGFVWVNNHSYVQSRPAWSIFAAGSGEIQNLAPAEKYDLIVGDSQTSLTQSVWSKGQYYYDTYGMVESWMGLCHGWAPASFMYPTPEKHVDVASPNGRTIRFYPSDIKALASLMWGTTHVQPRFVGVKCKSRYPDYDEVGRLTSDICFDSSAATWHMGVVSQLGANRRSMVMDATYNYEVWNHALYAYDYVYFNPQTLEPTQRLNKAIVPASRFNIDKFKKYRAPGTSSIVGISMNVTYMIPLHSTHSESQTNLTKTVNFVYDLELDDKGEIIGGEWYTNLHPDFLWTPALNARAVSVADNGIEPMSWDMNGPMPGTWMSAAKTAAMRGQPLAAIVERLVEQSRAQTVQP
jgi:hypothetical protein